MSGNTLSYSIDTTKYIDRMLTFCKSQGLNINLDNPQTIQDKLCWLNIYDTNPLKVKCADKIKIHDYCKDILGEDICVPIIKVYNNVSEINWDELPNQFVMKCNHGSGMNIICTDKSKLNKVDAINKLNRWMKDDFAFRNGFEAHYHDITPKIYVETILGNGDIMDYKFWCFNGEPKLWTINNGNGHGDIMYYYMDGSKCNLYCVKDNESYKKPRHFQEMVNYANLLSNRFKFVRVDFYEVDDRVFLGELTFTPGAMAFKYKNDDDNIKVGSLLKL